MNRGREVEHGSLVFSASGGMGNAARIFYKRLLARRGVLSWRAKCRLYT